MTTIRMTTRLPVQVDSTSLADLKAELYRKKGEAEKNKQKGNYRPEKVQPEHWRLYTAHCTLHIELYTLHIY